LASSSRQRAPALGGQETCSVVASAPDLLGRKQGGDEAAISSIEP
jgi:hypothetical protein